jgi:hypothetical protein
VRDEILRAIGQILRENAAVFEKRENPSLSFKIRERDEYLFIKRGNK